MNIYSIDFETTNIDPKIAHAVEVGLFSASYGLQNSFIRPPIPIPPETSAVHHITDADVANAESWGEIRMKLRDLCTGPTIFIAHNAKYEQDILKDTFEGLEVSWICTYKCALRIWPDAPNHKNETLRYWLGLQFLGRSWEQSAHSAGHDANVTYHICLKLLEHTTTEQMIAWSKEPAMLPKILFGKHYGLKWSEAPYDYLAWIMKTADMDADIKFNANAEITRRRQNVTTSRTSP